jgi:hypothetical protein
MKRIMLGVLCILAAIGSSLVSCISGFHLNDWWSFAGFMWGLAGVVGFSIGAWRFWFKQRLSE